MIGALVIPVPLAIAQGWAQGFAGDVDLMLAPRTPEAAYWSTLADLAAFRAALPQALEFWRRGARAMILRTNSPAVVHHVEKWGGVATHMDPSGRWRYWCDAATVDRYFGRIAQNAAASSLVTSSR
jgi:hypothetical protein